MKCFRSIDQLNAARGRRLTLFFAYVVLAVLAGFVSGAVVVPFVFFPNPALAAVGTALSTGVTGSWSIIMNSVAYQLIVSEPAAPGIWPPMAWAPPLAGPAGTVYAQKRPRF